MSMEVFSEGAWLEHFSVVSILPVLTWKVYAVGAEFQVVILFLPLRVVLASCRGIPRQEEMMWDDRREGGMFILSLSVILGACMYLPCNKAVGI